MHAHMIITMTMIMRMSTPSGAQIAEAMISKIATTPNPSAMVVGECVGECVGEDVVGADVGADVGEAVGTDVVGADVGADVGIVGADVGAFVGAFVVVQEPKLTPST